MSYVVLVDSSSDIPLDLATEKGISVVPMPVSIGNATYLEGINIFPQTFYPNFNSMDELPKTSQPNPATLKDKYEEILASDKEVIAIHLSSGLSSTYTTAQLVRETCSRPEMVHVIDSLGASFGYGLLALLTSEKIKVINNWPDLESEILKLREKMRYVFTLDTLEYLVKGGRVSKTAGFIGGLLDVKPILHITTDGRIEPFAKVRSRKGAIRKLVDVMQEEISDPEQQIIGISHSACIEDAQILAEEIKYRIPVKDILISQIGCVVGSHTGPGTLALFYQR
ncbi:MAG: DegV family protein [Desulfitobacterium hafniense]|nr:DegV family protein [Desulfitobacterium hafniense]